MPQARVLGALLLAFLLALGVLAVTAAACEGGGSGGKELTSLSTTLSGEGKEGEEITVAEGAKVKDKATLTGKNASKATGKVKYKIYSEKECKTLVKEAGEVTVSGESVPASSEEELEAGKSYYWQAHYGGDEKNDESTSPCTEVLKVKAKTSLSTKLSGGGEEGEEITVNEGTKVKDKATLTGTNSSSAEGKVLYKIFSDKECKTLVKEAGEESVSGGSVTASSEEELEGGKTYYWQATYKGDGLHKESTSSCGSEVLKVKAKTSLTTKLYGEGEEGEELTILEGSNAEDKAMLSGTNSSAAGGKLVYMIYSDSECKEVVAEAGEVTVSSGSIPTSNEEKLEGGSYYWRAHYTGDSLHQESTSSCSEDILKVVPGWERAQCVKEPGGGWNFKNANCTEETGGDYERSWSKVQVAGFPVVAGFQLTLSVAGTEVECPDNGDPDPVEAEGTIGNAGGGTITSVLELEDGHQYAEIDCRILVAGGKCNAPAKVEAVNLPWNTQLVVTKNGLGEKEVRDKISGTIGAPGWRLECSGGQPNELDETCSAPNASLAIANFIEGTVLTGFDSETEQLTCGAGNKETITGWLLMRSSGGAYRWIRVS